MAGTSNGTPKCRVTREERRPVRQVRQPEMVSADYILIALAAARHYDVIGNLPVWEPFRSSCS